MVVRYSGVVADCALLRPIQLTMLNQLRAFHRLKGPKRLPYSTLFSTDHIHNMFSSQCFDFTFTGSGTVSDMLE